MRVLITGGLGFIGSFLAESYRDNGHEVTVIDNLTANVVDTIDGVAVHHGDCANHNYVQHTFDLAVHCASPVGAVGLLAQRGTIVPEIVATTWEVAQVCADRQIPLINISTSEVYGRSGVYCETDDIRVPAKYSARLEYAVGKLAAEHTLQNMLGLSHLTIRPFNVAGPRQTRAKGFVLPTFAEQALQDRPLTVFSGGEQVRSFTAVGDLCEFILGVRSSHFDGRVINVGNPANKTTIQGLAEMVIERAGSKSTIEQTTGKAVHGIDYEEAEGHVKVPDITAAEAMGWTPEIGLGALVDMTIAATGR